VLLLIPLREYILLAIGAAEAAAIVLAVEVLGMVKMVGVVVWVDVIRVAVMAMEEGIGEKEEDEEDDNEHEKEGAPNALLVITVALFLLYESFKMPLK
jgi:hypothetical protein